MSETSRRLSYRKRKKLGLSFSEAFLEESGPHKARSVDRGYATVASPASVEQGDEQSEWDERQARVDSKDGLSRLMSDVVDAKKGDEASEEIFVGEGNMKEAMFQAFAGELSKLASPSSERDLGDAMLDAFMDEIEKQAGPMDIRRARSAMLKKRVPRSGRPSWGSTAPTRSELKYGRGRRKGELRSAKAHESRMAESGSGPDLAAAQKATGEAQRRVKPGSRLNPLNRGREQRSALRAAKGGAREGRARTDASVTRGGDVQSEKAYRQRMGEPAREPAPPPVDQPVPGQPPAPADAGWLQQRWSALTDPMAAAYAQGGLGAIPGGVWSGMKASPLLGGLGAGLAGMAIMPPALRAMGLQRDQNAGAVPGMVNIPGY